METCDGQRRARAGGELGVNGEWYRGGAFIATTDAPKSAPEPRRALTPEQIARMAADAERGARLAAWLDARRAELADVIATLTANTLGLDAAEWARRVADHAAGFVPSLGRTLWAQGSLSERQAECVAKAIIGRRTKRTADERDRLIASLTVEFTDALRSK